MKPDVMQQATEYSKKRRHRKRWQKVVTCLGATVVFCTTYALILPAITMENDPICGIDEHQHSETCYESIQTEQFDTSITCVLETHTHTPECYDAEENVICGLADRVIHTHDENCYYNGQLICPLPEVEEHLHDETCYETTNTLTCELDEDYHRHSEECFTVELGELTCGQEEQEPHYHTDGCYERTKTLICEIQDDPEHQHTEACYSLEKGTLICGLEEHDGHQHTDECREQTTALICEIPSNPEGHQHSDACYETATTLTCELEQIAVHIHTEVCYDENELLICGILSAEAHQHTEECLTLTSTDFVEEQVLICTLEEHTHEESCYPTTAPEVSPEETESVDEAEYTCGYETHLHDETCYDADGNLTCLLPEHEHTEECTTAAEDNSTEEAPEQTEITDETEYVCGYEAHTHDEFCYDSEGSLICLLPEHEHTEECTAPVELSETEQFLLEEVIALLDALPTYEEVDATLLAYEEAEDWDGYESYYVEVGQQGRYAYEQYALLSEEAQALVSNADKLWDLEWLWSAVTLIDEITSDTPTTVTAASTSEFIELNLYDYGSNINTLYNSNNKYPGFQWNGGAYLKSTYDRHEVDAIDFGNSMITDFNYAGSNNGKASTAQNIGNQGGDINTLDVSNYGVTNRPIGMSLNSSITDETYDVLSRTLGSDGYPALKDGTSLSYLFTSGTYATKKNTTSIDGLFQQNTTSGEYWYNSRLNHAQYGSNKFTLYNQIITPNFIVYPFGNFLPLNDITNSSNATQVSKITRVGGGDSNNPGYVQQVINDLIYASDYNSNATKQQLLEMLAKYREDLRSIITTGGTAWTTWTAKNAIVDYFTDGNGDNPSDDTSLITDVLLNKMYNIDWDVKTNFFFGMEMKMNFMQPKDGMTGNDTNQDGESDYPMVFYFTGDDDVWVYIDDVLFLDLSGIHRHVGGKIDFVNGKVHYYYLDTANTGDVSTTPYKTYTFAEILSAAGKSTDGLNSNGTFKDYTTHSFKFFYMERGSGSSVCRLNFNFPLLKQNSISVSKAVSSDTEILGDPDYKFQVLKANSDGTKTKDLFIAANTTYNIYDKNDNKIGTGTTDSNGVFTLKAGQRAEFTGIKENAGKYYVRELLEGTVLEQYGNVTVSGESTTTSNNVTIGSDTFTGMDSPVKDMSDGATAFRFTNDVDENKLGDLSISKVLTEYPRTREVKYYDIEVTLDGEKLPVGSTYTVGTATRTVTTAGIITIAADETATIANILAGTEFTVQETSGSAEGYTVTYTDSGGYTITVKDDAATGIIKSSAKVQLVVTNSEKGATVTIPGTKSLVIPDGTERTFTFSLTEVTNSTGATVKEGGLSGYTATATVKDEAQSFQFTINYAQVDVESLPARFYYRITEDAHDDALANNTAYVAEVTVSQTADGISAAVTGMWKDGTATTDDSADFVNTLVGDLSLEKIVTGATTDDGFSFSITLEPGTSGLDTLPTSYNATFYQQDGTTVPATLTPNSEGNINLTDFKHGEKAVIHGIPIGATWTITETDTGGYHASYTVNGGESKQGTTVTGTVTSGTTQVVCTNAAVYELPETGGIGTQWYTWGGLALMCGAVFLLYQKNIRRKEGRRYNC